NPRQIAQAVVVWNRDNGDLTGVRAGRIGADSYLNLLAGCAFKETVHVVGSSDIASTNSQKILAGGHIDTRLRERRTRQRIPVFTVVYARETIPAVFNLEVAA